MLMNLSCAAVNLMNTAMAYYNNLAIVKKLSVITSKVVELGEKNKPVVTEITDADSLGANIERLLKRIIGPILTVIAAAAVIYAIYLGVLYAKAEDASKRKDVQGRLIGACIGGVIIVVGMTMCFALNWTAIYHNTNSNHKFVDNDKDGRCDICKKGPIIGSSDSSVSSDSSSGTDSNFIDQEKFNAQFEEFVQEHDRNIGEDHSFIDNNVDYECDKCNMKFVFRN